MLNQQFGAVFTHHQTGTMKQAFDLAWPALGFAFRPGSREAQLARECLAAKILEVVAEGEANVRVIQDAALRRLPPLPAYYAQPVRSQT
jgi:hypothetical protein